MLQKPSKEKSEFECYIYTLSDPITNQIRYLGKTVNLSIRYWKHISERTRCKTHKERWINKLYNLGYRPTMEVIDIVPIKDWSFWEKWWIELLKTWNINLVNIAVGGNGAASGNAHHLFGKTHSLEALSKISKANKGKVLSQEHKNKISNALKGKQKPDGFIENLKNKNKGRKHSEEAKLKMSITRTGKTPGNKGKHKELPHGTVSGYSGWKCRCDLCKNAWKLYKRKN